MFVGKEGQTALATVRRPWYQARALAGLDNLDGFGALRMQDLRHNVVSWDVSREVSLEMAGKTVGHRSRQATEVFAHFAPDALRRNADERANAMQDAAEEAPALREVLDGSARTSSAQRPPRPAQDSIRTGHSLPRASPKR